ncbi:MAG: L,D-transpeptidase [Deltaproteobacteria bacterium]|nr:L,D-transpeptidase [Deltaproteobacteria bacterium]
MATAFADRVESPPAPSASEHDGAGEQAAPPSPAAADAKPAFEFVRETEPLFDEPFKSLRLAKSAWVLATPSADGEKLGMISGKARPRYRAHVENEHCKTPWIEIEPRGFICVKVRPSKRKPSKASPRRPRPLLGRYGIARRSAVFYPSLDDAKNDTKSRKAKGDMIKLIRSVKTDDGRTLWQTQLGEWITEDKVTVLYGSQFGGVSLEEPGGLRLPVAFAVNRGSRRARGSVKVFAEPSETARVAKRLRSKSVVTPGESSADGAFVSIGEEMWVRAKDLRIARAVKKPAEANDGHWIDVDVDEQVVVAYRGDVPIFATLMSSGTSKDPTPTGVYRVTRKKRETTMLSERDRPQAYAAAVPWPTYFYEGFAFHSAYWHNSFGTRRSHGCINLAPKDALRIYELLGPELPPGWLSVYGNDVHQPGSVVQIRSSVPVAPPPRPGDEIAASSASD